MTRKVCPNCGLVQEEGPECRRCGIIYSRYRGPRLVPSDQLPPGPPDRMRRFFRTARWVSLGLVLLVFVLILWDSPAPRMPTDLDAVRSAEVKLVERQEAVGIGHAHILELDERELNGWLDSHVAYAPGADAGSDAGDDLGPAQDPALEEARSSVRDVKIELLEDSLRAHVLFDFHGVELTLVLQGRLAAEDGYLRFEPASGKLGRMPLPGPSLRSAVRRLFDSPENREKFRLPADLKEIGVREGKLYLLSSR